MQNLFRTIKLYIELCKPGVMTLAILSAIVGLVLAPNSLGAFRVFIAIVFISMGAASAGAFNMCFEIELDAQMERTKKRPLPQDKISKIHAMIFATALGITSVASLGFFFNLLSAWLLFLTIFFYAICYTKFLKSATIHNIVIGGIPGAMPPLIGWAASMNSLNFGIWSFFFIIFFWIPPHSWSLALFKKEEYKKVKIPMLPVIRGVKHTVLQINIYSSLLIISSYLPLVFLRSEIQSSWLYALVVTICNAMFSYNISKLNRHQDDDKMIHCAKKLFKFSITYLLLLLLAAIIKIR